jgi:hypothetical protein
MLKQYIYRKLRVALGRVGLQITRYRHDLDSYFLSSKHEDLLLRKTAECLDKFICTQRTFERDTQLDTLDLTREFYELYRAKPHKYLPGSSGFNVLLCIFVFVRHFRPSLIIESGVYIGQSTWALRKASPSARLDSFDIDLSNLQYEDKTVTFHECDWVDGDWSEDAKTEAVCFFDDHVDQVRRVIEAYQKGFRYLLFDDNTPVEWLYLAGPGGAPMFDFMFFDGFDSDEVIEWKMLGRTCRYRVDVEYLRQGRDLVESYDKFPVSALSQINGFLVGNPLTVVRLRASETNA